MKVLRGIEIAAGLLLIALFFQPYIHVAGMSLPGYKLKQRLSSTYGFASRFTKRSDVTLGVYTAPLVYSVPVLGLLVLVLAARDRNVGGVDIAASVVTAGMVGYLYYKVSGKPLCRVGDGAWFSLVPAAVLGLAGAARTMKFAWDKTAPPRDPSVPPPIPMSHRRPPQPPPIPGG